MDEELNRDFRYATMDPLTALGYFLGIMASDRREPGSKVLSAKWLAPVRLLKRIVIINERVPN